MTKKSTIEVPKDDQVEVVLSPTQSDDSANTGANAAATPGNNHNNNAAVAPPLGSGDVRQPQTLQISLPDTIANVGDGNNII